MTSSSNVWAYSDSSLGGGFLRGRPGPLLTGTGAESPESCSFLEDEFLVADMSTTSCSNRHAFHRPHDVTRRMYDNGHVENARLRRPGHRSVDVVKICIQWY